MPEPHKIRIEKELQKMNLDFASSCMMIWELLSAVEDTKIEVVEYSKSYFARYYCVDLDTFHRWIQVFCPELWGNQYKTKRKFTIKEADYIFDKLGKLNFKQMPPQDRKELMNAIYKDTSWKKSRRYEEICLELEDRFPNENVKLNKIPPFLAYEILKEENPDFKSDIPSKLDEFFRQRIHVIQSIFPKYQQLTDHKVEVYRRYIRRWLSAKDDTSEEK